MQHIKPHSQVNHVSVNVAVSTDSHDISCFDVCSHFPPLEKPNLCFYQEDGNSAEAQLHKQIIIPVVHMKNENNIW